MSNGVVQFDEFKDIKDRDTKLNILFKTIVAHHEESLESCRCRQEKCDIRLGKLEKRKWLDKGIAVTSGGIGGFLAVFFNRMFMR